MGFFFKSKRGESPRTGLETGWQFYSKPTTLDGPGAIFRIDPHGVRYSVDQLLPTIERGIEAGGKALHCAQLKVSILARFLDMDVLGAGAQGDKVHKVEFEIKEPEIERTTDGEIAKALDPFLRNFPLKKGNRYFIIREARSAASMTYRVSNAEFAELTGKGAIAENIGTSATVSNKNDALQEIHQAFPQRMRVMFLPEEIAVITAGLSGTGPRLGRIPVHQRLEWREPEPKK